MGQFKPMVKMMTTEPTVELKLKKGGHVSMKGKGEHGHKSMPHMMDGGMTPAMSGAMPARGGVAPAARPMRPPLAARRRAIDRKSTRLNSSHSQQSRMPSSA